MGDLERGLCADERLNLDVDVIAIPTRVGRHWLVGETGAGRYST